MIEELGLKSILSIGKQDSCLLLDYCLSENIECSGKRIPFCKLEINLMENKKPLNLENQKIINLLSQINEILRQKPVTFQSLNGKTDFICPFFKTKGNCNFSICPYNSSMVKNTNCILSLDDMLSLTEIGIAKNISRTNLLKIIFGIEVSEKWDTVKNILKSFEEEACNKCGYFLDKCKVDKRCEKRTGVYNILKVESIIPSTIMDNYPLSFIIFATFQEFGEFAKHLFPKRALTTYLNSMKG